MNWPALPRWRNLWNAIGAKGDAVTWYSRLSQAYGADDRHYHNQQHIADCLTEFDSARDIVASPELVEFALWFHDLVYDTHASNNEERSAEEACRCLEAAGRTDLGEGATQLIMATKFHKTVDSDSAIIVDVDLCILGADKAKFSNYEAGIRKEYMWVPEDIFNAKRAEILQNFLTRERIYSTQFFAQRYERKARQNLENAIRALARKSC